MMVDWDLEFFISRMGRGSNNPNFKIMIRQRRRIEWQMKNVTISYDDGWREIFRDVSMELGFPRDHIERINTAWWRYVNEMMSNPVLPTIKIMYMCSIHPSVKLLYRYCNTMGRLIEKIYRGEYGANGKRVGDVKKMEEHLSALQETYSRLTNEAGNRSVVVNKMKKSYSDKEWNRHHEKEADNRRLRLVEVTMEESRAISESEKGSKK